MDCPKCYFKKTHPVTKGGDKMYCPSCSYAWAKGEEKVSKGKLSFDGPIEAKTMVDGIVKGMNLGDELTATIFAQLTAAYYDQWFEGFKAGILSQLMKNKETQNDNGETRAGQPDTTKSTEAGAKGFGSSPTGSKVRKRQSQDPANPNFAGRDNFIREQVGDTRFEYHRGIKVPENIYQKAAEIKEAMKVNLFVYNGKELIASTSEFN